MKHTSSEKYFSMKNSFFHLFLLVLLMDISFTASAQHSGKRKTIKGVYAITFMKDCKKSDDKGYHFCNSELIGRRKNIPLYPISDVNLLLLREYPELEKEVGKPNMYDCYLYDMISDCNLLKSVYCVQLEVQDTPLYSPEIHIQQSDNGNEKLTVAFNLKAKVIEYRNVDYGRILTPSKKTSRTFQGDNSGGNDTRDYLGSHFYVLDSIISESALTKSQKSNLKLVRSPLRKINVYPSEYLWNRFSEY